MPQRAGRFFGYHRMSAEPSATESEVLLFEHSPYRNLDAIVQHDSRTVYFYLNEPPGEDPAAPRRFGTRACWVRNLVPGPLVVNPEAVPTGTPPLLPRTHTRSREAQPLPSPESLEIVWFEEGNGAALVQRQADGSRLTLAVIPPWSGRDGFHGYAAGCGIEHDLCWPLPEHPALQRRIDRAREFWLSFADADPFPARQTEVLASYRAALLDPDDPVEEAYFSIDGGRFPPRGLVQFSNHEHHWLLTVGMSLCPQPTVELYTEHPSARRRIELGICLDRALPEPQLAALRQRLATLAAYPWNHQTWLGPGHSCRLPELGPDGAFALLVPDAEIQADARRQIVLPEYRQDATSLLWLLPLEPEQARQLEAGEVRPETLLPALRSGWFRPAEV